MIEPSGPADTNRYRPPSRRSTVHEVRFQPRAPYHRVSSGGWVNASKTSRAGAVKDRVSTISRSVGIVTVSSVIALHLRQQRVEALVALLPVQPKVLQPRGDLLQGLWREPARAALLVATAGDEPGPLQDLEVLGDGGLAHLERGRQFGDRRVAGRQAGEDRAPGRIGEREERRVEQRRVRGHP